MQDIAPADQRVAPAPPQVIREARVSKALRKAIALLESGECRTQQLAAAKAGLHPTYLSRALRKVEIQAFIARKRSENLSVGALQASFKYPQLVFAASEHVAEKASARLLEQTGDLKSTSSGISINVNNNIACGYVVKLREPGESHVNTALPAVEV